MAVPWKDDGEHINVLETRAFLLAMRWRARNRDEHGKRFLHLVDSMVTMGAITKGRSSSLRLRRVVAKCNAVLLASHFYPCLGYVRSAENPADRPSRKAEGKSTLRKYAIESASKRTRREAL